MPYSAILTEKGIKVSKIEVLSTGTKFVRVPAVSVNEKHGKTTHIRLKVYSGDVESISNSLVGKIRRFQLGVYGKTPEEATQRLTQILQKDVRPVEEVFSEQAARQKALSIARSILSPIVHS